MTNSHPVGAHGRAPLRIEWTNPDPAAPPRPDGVEGLVSVIVPVKNSARTLAQALDSIIAQTYPHIEIVVVDARSTDETERIALGYPPVRFIQQTGRGLSDAWNCGIGEARGALIALLDSDDRWMPDKLRLQTTLLAREPDYQYVDGMVQFYLEEGAALPATFKPEQLDTPHIGYMPGTVLVRRELFDTLGVFDTEIAIAGDTDWFARAKDRSVRWGYVPEVVLHKRVHTASLSLNREGGARYRHELLGLLHRSVARQRGQGKP